MMHILPALYIFKELGKIFRNILLEQRVDLVRHTNWVPILKFEIPL